MAVSASFSLAACGAIVDLPITTPMIPPKKSLKSEKRSKQGIKDFKEEGKASWQSATAADR
jgi:hypothetical protein